MKCKKRQPELMGTQIARLPPVVVGLLRSTTILSDVAQIAEELVCNSLDAGATKIEIAVDGENCHMRVDDDGCGISREDLALVGERHATSKLHCLDELEGGVATLGFRGEALSSLSNVSLVEITSRCRRMPNTYRKILKGGATLSIGLSGEERTHGTTVVVKDMFYNQPVRRRLLNSSQRKILQSVKDIAMRYVLIHPQVSFTVKDLARKDIIFHTKSAGTLKSTLRNLFGVDVLSKLQEIDYAQDHLRLTGFLSRAYHSHSSKALQYFYINRRYVLKTSLHKLMNSHGGKSKDSLGRVNFEEQGARGEIPSSRHLFPAFVLNLTCPFSDYDITFEASKTLVEFQDWEPVVTFVRHIILKIWGDQSDDNKQGYRQALGSNSAGDAKTNSSNGNSHRTKTLQQQNGSKDEIPPMAVRRALVQIDSPHPRDFKKYGISKRVAAATSDDSPERLGTLTKSLVLSCPSRKSTACVETHSMTNSKDETMTNKTKIFRTDFVRSRSASSKPLWQMTRCRQQLNPDQPEEPFPAILGSDWFSNSHLSTESEEQHVMDSGYAPVPSSFCKGSTSAYMSEEGPYRRSSFASKWSVRRCSSPTSSSKTTPQKFMKSRNPGWVFLSPVEDTQETVVEKWWDPDITVPKTPLRSPSTDSLGFPRILSTSDFLPEVSSCSPVRVSSGAHPSYELKWPEFDSDHSESEIDWSSRIQTKRRRADDVSDDELADLFSAKASSFNRESEKYLGTLEINKSNYISCNLDNEDASVHMKDGERHSDGAEAPFQVSTDYRTFSANGVEQGDALQCEGHGFAMDSYNPRSKRRLHLDLDTGSDILKLHSQHYENQKPCKQDKARDSSGSEIHHTRRRFSGPPFYRPPKRHGVHMNPSTSLSTVETIWNIAEDGAATKMEPDIRSNIAPDAICRTNQNRNVPDVPRRRIELMEIPTIQPGERVLDCDSQTTQATPLLDHEEFEKQKETVDASEVECPSDNMKGSQQRVEVDVHEHCKYRSTDVNNAAIDGENIPVDTVKAMFKEWSNPCMKKDDDILDLSSGILASNVNSLLPESITKDVFKQARVLQQVDTKFIASVSCGVLLLIDQHAADERVRLEELRHDVLGGHSTKQISLLSSTQQLTLAFSEQQTLQTYSQQIQDWGWRFKIVSEKKSTASHNRLCPSTDGTCKVLLSAVPAILGVRLTGADLVEYLRQLTDTQGSSTPPPAVIRLLNNKACRGAIMFGDKLLPAECSQLVDHLKKTLLCFQCAHGRPTMIPLVDIQALHRRFDPIVGRREPGASMESDTRRAGPSRRVWHGLRSDFKPNVERAQARLARAQGV